MLIGYMRLLPDDPAQLLQTEALQQAGCGLLYEDQGVPRAGLDRPGLQRAMAALTPGDVLVVWRLDRLGRSLSDVVAILNDLAARGAGFRALADDIDTTGTGGVIVFQFAAALSAFERSSISERARSGVAQAKRRRRRIGRPPSLTRAQVKKAKQRVLAGETTAEIAASLGVSYITLYRAFWKAEHRDLHTQRH